MSQQLENVNSLKESETTTADIKDEGTNNISEPSVSTKPIEPTNKEPTISDPLPFTEQGGNFERLREMNDDLESTQKKKKKWFN